MKNCCGIKRARVLISVELLCRAIIAPMADVMSEKARAD